MYTYTPKNTPPPCKKAQKIKKRMYNTCVYIHLELKMKRWNLYLPEELIEKYRVLASQKGVSSAEMARIAMEKYYQALEKAKNQASETTNAA
jgi:predicted DNA-binding protein